MHISNMAVRMLGTSGIVGGGPPIAMGVACSSQFEKTKEVAVDYFGNGASNEGRFHEAANMAASFKLPCVFVCENNGYGDCSPQANHQTIVDVADGVVGYGLPGVVDGINVIAVYEATEASIKRARAGQGSTYLNAKAIVTMTMKGSAGWFSHIVLMRNLKFGRNAIRSRVLKVNCSS